MKNIIVDLDGTLANCDHRIHHVRRADPDWDSFFAECGNDVPNPWCVQMINSMVYAGYHVFIVSARSRHVEAETISWFQKHDLFDSRIHVHLLRDRGDSTPDQELKRAWLRSFEHRGETLLVVDDREKVVKMWREEGLTCLQCYSWPEFTTKAPDLSTESVTV